MEGEGWSGNAVTETSYNRNQLRRSSVMWCDKKGKLEMDCLLLLLTVTRACVPVLHDALSCENVAANVRDLSPPQSPLLGRVEAWGEGKRNRAGNIVHHTFCLIIAIFILEYPSAGASAEEMRETTCKGQINLPFKFEPHARPKSGDLLASSHRLQPRTWSF